VALNAYNKNISLKDSCMELTSLSEEEFNKFTDPKTMV
jgi:fumarate hydratase class II